MKDNYSLNKSDNQLDPVYLETMAFIKNLTKFGINLGLHRIRSLLQRLGNPHQRLRIIHIGGTNGKGSTTAILQSVLQQAGYRVGMFISPHLHDYRERIRINDELISRADIVRGISTMRPVLEEMVADGMEHPTEFEVSTALALYYFAEKRPDFVLLEVGLGGEIDSTNVVTPVISVLTSISMDHMDYLGETLEEITRVKAGIIKEGVPVITSVDKPESLQIIKQFSTRKRSRLLQVGRDVRWEKVEGQILAFHYLGLKHHYLGLELSLYGEHQFINASVALAVCEMLEELFHIDIDENAVRKGLETVRWPGRLEMISQNPKILLDGAHNTDGMKTLVKALRDYEGGPFQRNKLLLCIGILQDKEVEKIVNLIAPLANEIIVTKPDSPRAGDWKAVGRLAEKYLDPGKIHVVEDPVLAVEEGIRRMETDDMLCVTGSLYMISAVRKYLLQYFGSL
ncbi:MAG: bifunctional folylpolyglutamate synthase/dihydrofolate synthase [Peptococcaceae bacterium]|nr:bifunctional folylpolyglutamate synthase/dihydrofolate synthase [Peptococcaceae bacterium]